MAFNLWTELNVNPALTWLRMERNRVLVVSSHQLQTRPKDFCTTLFLFVNIMYVLMEVWIATLFFSGSSKKSKLNLPLGFLNTETRLTWNVFFYLLEIIPYFCLIYLKAFSLYSLMILHWIGMVQWESRQVRRVLHLCILCQSQNSSSVSGQPSMITPGLPYYTVILTLPCMCFHHPSSSLGGWSNWD